MARARKPVIAGNWKMYKTQQEARDFFAAFKPLVAGAAHCEIIVAPPFTAIAAAVEAAAGSAIAIAAQDVYWANEGAFTGEVSPRMLVEAGCGGVIIAHSERRQFFGETDETRQSQGEGGAGGGIDADPVRGRDAGATRGGRYAEGAGPAIPGLAGRVDHPGILTYHHGLRTGLGHWHGPHGHSRNRSRGAQVPARSGG